MDSLRFASPLDQIGTLTKNVRDAALLTNIICGHDPCDSTSAPLPAPDFTGAIDNDIKGVKLVIPKEYFVEGMDKEIEAAVYAAIKNLEGLSATPVEVSLPHTGL